MECKEYRGMLDDYVEGLVDEDMRAGVAAHLSACVDCAELHRQLDHELKLYSLYLLDINPPPSAWGELCVKIDQERATARAATLAVARPTWIETLRCVFVPQRFATAFALLVIVGVAAFVLSGDGGGSRNVVSEKGVAPLDPAVEVAGKLTPPVDETKTGERAGNTGLRESTDGAGSTLNSRARLRPGASKGVLRRVVASGSKMERVDSRRQIVAAGADADEDLLHRAEQRYQTAIAILRRDADRRRRIEPEVYAYFVKSLTAADQTIARTQRAVRDNPGDPVAAQHMLAAYSKKIDVLMEMAR